ncbi:MAG TPA: hypothetical protein VIV12_22245 [Streptosporangiaceae bacterium]
MTEELAAAALPWWHDDPARLDRERAAMFAVAPNLVWRFESSGRWVGHVPLWPISRRQPSGVAALVGHRAFAVKIVCGPAYPMIEPLVWPTEIKPPLSALGWTEWHLLPSAALCLLRDKTSWDPSTLAADLVPKISGWYIEYHLKSAGYIDRMTECGIANDDSLDPLLDEIDEIEGQGGGEEEQGYGEDGEDEGEVGESGGQDEGP